MLKAQSTANILDVAAKPQAKASPITTGDVTGMVGDEGQEFTTPLASAPIFDRFGDDRFTDNILRALEGLPQNGDDEEEEAAAEEGALIEASGYRDPAEDVR